ncbi:MAG: stage III sporulation protein AC [Peptococcia bacterium]
MRIELIFQIAGIGLITSIFHTVLKQAGKEEYSVIATLAGVSLALIVVIRLIAQLLAEVKDVFFLQ